MTAVFDCDPFGDHALLAYHPPPPPDNHHHNQSDHPHSRHHHLPLDGLCQSLFRLRVAVFGVFYALKLYKNSIS